MSKRNIITEALEELARDQPDVFAPPSGELKLLGMCEAYGCCSRRHSAGTYCEDHLFGDVEIDGLPVN